MSINTIIDIYHQTTIDFDRVKNAGVLAIIHKATEGETYRDSQYATRRAVALEKGFLWSNILEIQT